jgi:hypothetical protein
VDGAFSSFGVDGDIDQGSSSCVDKVLHVFLSIWKEFIIVEVCVGIDHGVED